MSVNRSPLPFPAIVYKGVLVLVAVVVVGSLPLLRLTDWFPAYLGAHDISQGSYTLYMIALMISGGGMAGGLLQGVIDEHNVKLATIKPQYQRKSDTSQGGARPADDWEVDETLRDNRGGFSPMFKD